MSIAQAQAMRKAREDIEALKAQVALLTERFDNVMDMLLAGQPIASPAPIDSAGVAILPWSPDADASIPPAAWDATPPAFDPDLIYNISPADIKGPPISSMEPIVSANIALPPKKRGRPPKA